MKPRCIELSFKMGSALAVVACLALTACSVGEPLPPLSYEPPSMPTLPAANGAVKLAVADAKLSGAIEISDFRLADFGPGRFMACIRGTSNDDRTNAYTVFFNNNSYMGLRLPVGSDDCAHQSYHPFVPDVPPAKPVPKKAAKKART
jgi:hypothetical protein